MLVFEVFLKSIGYVFGFAFANFLMGHALPRGWLIKNHFEFVQRMLIGFSILVVLLRLPYREDLPVSFFVFLSLGVLIYGAIRWIHHNLNVNNLFAVNFVFSRRWVSLKGLLISLVVLLPPFIILYFPLISSHAIYFQNLGPDLDGDLLSASFVNDGHTWDRLMQSLHEATGSYKWWHLENQPWSHPDFREAVAVEFFPRSLRWGHAVLTALISHANGEPVWFAFFVLTAYSFFLCPFVILDACISRGLNYYSSTLISLAVLGTQTYALMLYEGIAVQLIATPVLLYFTLNSRLIFLGNLNVGQKFTLALLLSALMSTFGEGIQILAVFFASLITVYMINRRQLDLLKVNLLQLVGVVVALLFLLSPTVFFDFILWSLARLKESFAGGALHFDWSIFSLLLSIPYMKLGEGGLELMIDATRQTRALECAVLLVIGWVLLIRKKNYGFDFFATAIALTVFVLINHRYAIWKVAAIYQPLMLLCFFQMLPERIKSIPREYFLILLVALSTLGTISLLLQYRDFGQPVHLEQFNIKQSGANGTQYVFVTPSQSRVYLKLGSHGELIWANGGWRGPSEPDFNISNQTSLPIALFFDCDAEGRSRCAKIKKMSPLLMQRTIYLTSVPIKSLLGENGLVDHAAFAQFVKRSYGVEELVGRARPQD